MDAMDYIIKKHKAYETDLAKKAKEENQQDQARILKRIANEKYLKRIAQRNEQEYDIDIGMSGCSCTLVIIIGNTIYYGFVGDTLLCLSKVLTAVSEKNTTNYDLVVTKPWHLPDEMKEKMRVYKHHGEVRGGVTRTKQKKKESEQEDEDEDNMIDDHILKHDEFQVGIFDDKYRARMYMRGR